MNWCRPSKHDLHPPTWTGCFHLPAALPSAAQQTSHVPQNVRSLELVRHAAMQHDDPVTSHKLSRVRLGCSLEKKLPGAIQLFPDVLSSTLLSESMVHV